VIAVSQRHPTFTTSDPLNLIERRGIPLFRTWRTGSLRLRWASAGITARAFLEEGVARTDDGALVAERPIALHSQPTGSWGLVVRRAGMLVGMRLDRPRTVDSAARVDCCTLILHGTDDTVVDIAEARRFAAAFPSPPHWFDVPGARHSDVIETGGDDLLARIPTVLAQAAIEGRPTRSAQPGET
jgi:alpha-beta hydrolase superfamily lysophospholipase